MAPEALKPLSPGRDRQAQVREEKWRVEEGRRSEVEREEGRRWEVGCEDEECEGY